MMLHTKKSFMLDDSVKRKTVCSSFITPLFISKENRQAKQDKRQGGSRDCSKTYTN